MPNNPKASSYQEKVTGIIILFPTLMVHLLEVCSKNTLTQTHDSIDF